jgi:hypothetical protein
MPTPKQKVKFLIDVEVKDHNNEIEFTAKAGEVKELSASSANRWLRRNACERVRIINKPAAAPKPKSTVKKPAPKQKTEAKTDATKSKAEAPATGSNTD